MPRRRKTAKRRTPRQAGVIAPFYSPHKDLTIHYSDGNDCLAQCFYAMRYTNLENSELLQRIATEKWGINTAEVALMLDLAYGVDHKWVDCLFRYATNNGTVRFKKSETSVMARRAHYDRFVKRLKQYLNPNEAVLCFFTHLVKMRPIRKEPHYMVGHYVVAFLDKDGNPMIRDPQVHKTQPLHTYLKENKRTQDGMSILTEDQKTVHRDYAVNKEIILTVFGDVFNLDYNPWNYNNPHNLN